MTPDNATSTARRWSRAPHGTRARYLLECYHDDEEPCDPCRAANARYSRQQRKKETEDAH